jgi:outer membrane protein assembly factor BamB
LLWEDSLPASSTTAFAVTSHAGIVAIAGTRNLESGANPFVRAYDVRTGLLRWEDEIPSGAVPTNGFFDELVAHEGRIVAGGSRGGFLVQAYDARSGNVLWRRQTEADFGVVLGLTASRQRVYAAGLDNGNWLVEAYEAKSGDIAWEDRFENAGLIGIARDDDTGRGRLFVVGDVQTPDRFSDFLIRAYDISRHHPRKADLSRLRRHPN